jgi:hypothetical protein
MFAKLVEEISHTVYKLANSVLLRSQEQWLALIWQGLSYL